MHGFPLASPAAAARLLLRSSLPLPLPSSLSLSLSLPPSLASALTLALHLALFLPPSQPLPPLSLQVGQIDCCRCCFLLSLVGAAREAQLSPQNTVCISAANPPASLRCVRAFVCVYCASGERLFPTKEAKRRQDGSPRVGVRAHLSTSAIFLCLCVPLTDPRRPLFSPLLRTPVARAALVALSPRTNDQQLRQQQQQQADRSTDKD